MKGQVQRCGQFRELYFWRNEHKEELRQKFPPELQKYRMRHDKLVSQMNDLIGDFHVRQVWLGSKVIFRGWRCGTAN